MIAPVALGLLAAAVVGATSGEFRLTVLHTNDMHAHFDGTNDGRGGFARLRSALQAERARAVANGAPVIYLDAGDNFHGTDFYEVLRWEPVADLIGDLGVDAMVRTGPRHKVAARVVRRVVDVERQWHRLWVTGGNGKSAVRPRQRFEIGWSRLADHIIVLVLLAIVIIEFITFETFMLK